MQSAQIVLGKLAVTLEVAAGVPFNLRVPTNPVIRELDIVPSGILVLIQSVRRVRRVSAPSRNAATYPLKPHVAEAFAMRPMSPRVLPVRPLTSYSIYVSLSNPFKTEPISRMLR